ncbi:rhodanese-like domain-containing protein [Mycobacterium sp. 1274761.0]|uniref:MBL fold metallo-hydrolase n=1 Tax=Mycobacterium sp. 1274761.0 TaxID=1834077 RepID=UPI0007FEC6B5|nr:MBL fold metallo-hydrolase [Mycobacterium sp. 1274761.0]OBK77288.1 MBL fold metallo-hydrolase [Mycobacterium sp. 1274761.0]
MQVEILETSGLGDRSYVVTDADVAVVVDPQRDIDRVLDLVGQARITHVLETHIHNDYVTGGLELSRAVGAEYVVPAGEKLGYPARRVRDGDVIDAGTISLRVIHTPGHTHHHVSYELLDETGRTAGVFTGGSLLFGSTGRTDLVGDDQTEALTRAQYRSVRRLAESLTADAPIYPTHGFGSFCSATPVDDDSSTIGEQRDTNPALTKSERDFVDELLAGLSAYPAYYAHMGVINAEGPPSVDLSLPKPLDADELRRRLEAGEWVVDLRHRVAFAAGHLAGSLGFESSGSFVTYLGWLHPWGTPLTLIAEDEDQIAGARRELARIGIDDIAGAAPVHAAEDAGDQRAYRVADFAALADVIAEDGPTVLDVRQPDEFSESRVTGAVNIPLHELLDRIGELPDGPTWVHCASGYRASIAASILDSCGRDVVLIDDDFDAAKNLGITSTD